MALKPEELTGGTGGHAPQQATAMNLSLDPWSIPLIGNVFKSQTTSSTKSRFFVFLRASVLRSTNYEDLRYASAPALSVAGVGDDLPVVEPRIIR